MAVETEERARQSEAEDEQDSTEATGSDETGSGTGSTLALAGLLGLAAAGLAAYLARRTGSRDEPSQRERDDDLDDDGGAAEAHEGSADEPEQERREDRGAHAEGGGEEEPQRRDRPEAQESERGDEATSDADEDRADEPTARDRGSDPEAEEKRDEADEAQAVPEADGSAAEVLRGAREQIAELTGREAESISALERVEGGWRVQIELVELSRIPSTTDVLASYELQLDEDGEVVGYSRGRRYHRSEASAQEGE